MCINRPLSSPLLVPSCTAPPRRSWLNLLTAWLSRARVSNAHIKYHTSCVSMSGINWLVRLRHWRDLPPIWSDAHSLQRQIAQVVCPQVLWYVVGAYMLYIVYSVLVAPHLPRQSTFKVSPSLIRCISNREHRLVPWRSRSNPHQQRGSSRAARRQFVHHAHQIAVQGDRQQHHVQNRLPRPEDLRRLQEL